MPAQLAAAAPAADRASTETYYRKLLTTYEELAPKNGFAARDVAPALALYLGASYAVYHDVEVTDETMAALARQLGGLLSAMPAWTNASVGDRQDMYEQFAILGMLMGVARTKPITAEARASAKAYLEGFLKAGVDEIQIGERGLVISGGAAPSAPATPAPAPDSAPEIDAPAPPAARMGRLQIEAVAFRQKPSNGNMMMTPFVLFRSGDAVLDMEALVFPGGYDAHRAKYPGQWTKWRRAGKGFEIIVCQPVDPCKKPPYWWRVTYDFTKPGLPRGFKFDGNYGTSSGSFDGTVSAARWRNLRFHRDGRFTTHNFSSHTVTVNEGIPDRAQTIAGGHGSKKDGGTYLIDGYRLTLRFDDGTVQQRTIVSDPKPKIGIMWLDGDVYTRSDGD